MSDFRYREMVCAGIVRATVGMTADIQSPTLLTCC
jgi:hypothetical protein